MDFRYIFILVYLVIWFILYFDNLWGDDIIFYVREEVGYQEVEKKKKEVLGRGII